MKTNYENYLDQVRIKNSFLAESIMENTRAFFELFKDKFDYKSHINALFFGHVQSGKTAQVLGVISHLSEEDIPVFLYLTTDNVILYNQTYERIQKNFSYFTTCNEHDDIEFLNWNLSTPLILVLKKNARILKKWRNLFGGKVEIHGRPLVIVDDEADASSLNTLVNKGKRSTINMHLTEIKKLVTSSLYIQLTATPQAILLQNKISGWSPDFSFFFKPGNSYIGGNYIYSRPKSYAIIETPEFEFDEIKRSYDVIPDGLREALMSFLIICAYFKFSNRNTCNFLIHPI